MSTRLVTISRESDRCSALELLLAHGFQSLPVVDDERLVGMVTTSDFLREFSYGESAAARLPAEEFVESAPEPIDCTETLDAAAHAMMFSGTKHVAVVSGHLPLGVVTRRDIWLAKCRLDARRMLGDECVLPGPASLHELVAESPVVRPGTPLGEAAERMASLRRQAVAVINQAGRFVGVLTETGVLRAMEGSLACGGGMR
jgi:CBS domain-containing protein